jgi:hypothetical protein
LSESAGVTYAWDSIADKITAFMIYCVLVTVFAAVMIYKVSPIYGKRNPMVYLSICSTVGSISIMAIKGFGIALKLTFAGNNQFSHPSTYVFAIVVVVCILTQMNYFNKALSQFSTNMLVFVCQTPSNRAATNDLAVSTLSTMSPLQHSPSSLLSSSSKASTQSMRATQSPFFADSSPFSPASIYSICPARTPTARSSGSIAVATMMSVVATAKWTAFPQTDLPACRLV